MKLQKEKFKYVFLIISIIVTVVLIKSLSTKDTYSLEDNTFSDNYVLNVKWLDYIAASNEEKEEYDLIPNKFIYLYESNVPQTPSTTTYPSYYNLKDYGYVTEPRNQGSLGLCWAFAAISSIESQLLVSKISNISNPLIFSERQLDYALAKSQYIIENYNPYTVRDRIIGTGGFLSEPNHLSLSGIAPVSQDIFGEYNINTNIKKSLNEVFNLDNVEYTVDGYNEIGGIGEGNFSIKQSWINDIKEHILTYGALSIVTIGPNQAYGGSCLYYDTVKKAYLINVSGDCNSKTSGTHAMSIIGWDDDYEYEYCRLESTTTSNLIGCENIVSGRGAFILKNSWGTSTPYPYIAYESAVDDVTGVTKVSKKNWDNNYDISKSYKLIKNTAGETIISYKKISQIKEKLVKISFDVLTMERDITYNIYISTDSTDNYQKIGTITAPYAGGYSIDIDSDIILNSGEFKIKILSNNGRVDDIYAFTKYQDSNSNYMAETNVLTENGYIDTTKKINISTNTRNIPTGAALEYRLIDANNTDISSMLNISENYVLNNIVKPTISIKSYDNENSVTLQTLYNQEVLDNTSFKISSPELFWSSGDGSINNPFIVNNLDEFLKIGTSDSTLKFHYKLGNDIDLSKIDWDSNEIKNGLLFSDNMNPQYKFTGSLDGDNHLITGLNYTRNVDNHGCAIFGALEDATIKNLIINDFEINTQSGNFKSLLATEARNSLFENIIITDSVNIAGQGIFVGGLVADAYDSRFHKIANYSNVTAGRSETAGIVPSCFDCEIHESYNYGNIFSTGDAGGIVSFIYGTNGYIHDVYNYGNVSTSSGGYAGGIVGYCDSILIHNVYNINNGTEGGGIYGNIASFATNTGILNAYSNDNGHSMVGINYKETSVLDAVEMKTITELLNKKTYDGYDFNNIWDISGSYAYLKNFNLKKLTDIQIQMDTEINMEPDTVHNINLSYYPNNATIKKVKYTSSDDSVASVDINGKVIAKSAGSATISIKSIDSSNITRNITVTVEEDKGIVIDNYKLDDNIYIKVDTVTNIEDFLNHISFKNNNYRISLSLMNTNISTGEKLFLYKNDNLINSYSITVLGDITGTGTINVSDVAKLYQYIQGSISMDSVYQMAGDVTFDTQLKVNDVAKLYQYVRGNLESLN